MLNLGKIAVTLLALCTAAHAQGEFAVKDGDRVLFYGDSITDGRGYTNFTETYIVTRFPKLKVNFTHSGWSGDRVTGGGGGPIDLRLSRDALAYKPTVMTIMLGMNDGNSSPFSPANFDTFSKGYAHIVERMKQEDPGVRITAIQPSPYDDVTRAPNFEGGYNGTLLRYSDFLADYAKQQNLQVADFNHPVTDMLKKAVVTDPALAVKLLPDRIHPSTAVHLVLATALIKSWNGPALVTAVQIDGGAPAINKAENSVVTDLKKGDSIKWTQLDGSLPMPIDTKEAQMALVVNSSDVVAQLNQEPLTVTGLTSAKYDLKIDDVPIGSFTKEQLASGINLASLPTPMMAQAMQVHILTQKRSSVHNTRWRSIQVPVETDQSPQVQAAAKTALPALLAAFDAEDADLADRQRAAAQPMSHHYELTPQP